MATLDAVARQFGVEPGIARHGEDALRLAAEEVDDTEVRDDEASVPNGYVAVLRGHFAVFNSWTEIDSFFEGRFMESIAPGAFKKTMEENRQYMRCLLQHGRDPQYGDKPLGRIDTLEEDDVGARYEVLMHDTALNRDLVPALKDGLYGASFRFQVMREEVTEARDAKKSDHNPDGIEERVITEARVKEFGPVTFPAYQSATAGVRSRSLNDWMLNFDVERFARVYPDAYPVRLAQLLHVLRAGGNGHPSTEEEEPAAPPSEAPEQGERAPRSSTRLSGAARKLRTTRKLEEPKWKL
jgi:HK97 family phage prohead protease